MSEVSRSVRFALALVLSLGVALAPWFYKLSFNLSESLPGSVYLVKRGAPAELRRGMLVEFQPARSVSRRAFVKRITALPGDRIMRAGSEGREFWLAGSPNVFLGYAKRLSRKGAPLAPSRARHCACGLCLCLDRASRFAGFPLCANRSGVDKQADWHCVEALVKARLCFLLFTALLALPAQGKDFGVLGAQWEIAEPDFLVQIERKLQEKGDGVGEMMRAAALAYMTELSILCRVLRETAFPPNPACLTHLLCWRQTLLTKTAECLPERARLINPLEHVSLRGALAFVDGRKPAHIAWALGQSEDTRIILVAGRPIDLMREHARRFWFDQQGVMVRRLGIEQIPALVSQQGSQLRIEELALP